MAPPNSKLYHYTSEEGYEGIRRSGKINPSTNFTKDAVLGRGVYLTHLPPTESNAKIISNNWDGGLDIGRRFMDQYLEKVDVCLEFNSRDLIGLKHYPGDRDVVLYPGSIDLERVPYKVYRRGDDLEAEQEESSCVIL